MFFGARGGVILMSGGTLVNYAGELGNPDNKAKWKVFLARMPSRAYHSVEQELSTKLTGEFRAGRRRSP